MIIFTLYMRKLKFGVQNNLPNINKQSSDRTRIKPRHFQVRVHAFTQMLANYSLQAKCCPPLVFVYIVYGLRMVFTFLNS